MKAHTNKRCVGCGTKMPASSEDTQCLSCLLKLGIDYADDLVQGSLSEFDGADFLADGVVPKFDDYELIEEINRGGMGIVYRAKQVSLNRTVAIKTILAGQLATKTSRQRFQTEATAAARLDHPGIVPIYEVGEAEGQHFFSMKLIEGDNLGSKITEFALQSSDSTTESQNKQTNVAKLMARVADAVAYAHQHGVLHRDIKPNNILVDNNGEPHLTDFGLAKLTGHESDGLTLTSTIVGSPSYIAPEQALSNPEEVTIAADVYGLGAVLYELLTGRPPFLGKTVMETVRQVTDVDPVAPRKIVSKVHPDLETIAMKCLEKQPTKRYATAAEVAEELKRFVAGKPIVARPVGQLEHISRWCNRNRWLASALAMTVLVAIAGVAGVFSQWRVAVAEKETARREAYRANIRSATAALQLHNVPMVRQALDSASEEYRGWEWRYLNRQLDRSAAILASGDSVDHKHAHKQCRFEEGGMRIQATVFDETYRTLVWSTSDFGLEKIEGGRDNRFHNQLVARPPVKNETVFSSTHEAYRLDDGALRLRERGSKTDIGTLWNFQPNQPGALPTFSHTGKRLAAWCDDNRFRVWNSRTGEELLSFSNSVTDGTDIGSLEFHVAFTPDDTRILSFDSDGIGSLAIWDSTTGELVFHPKSGLTMDLSRDGQLLAVGQGYPGNGLEVWDVATGERIAAIAGKHQDGVLAIAFNDDASTVLTGSYDQTIRIWDVKTKRELAVLEEHKGAVRDVKVSPDGTRFASASADGTICIWDYGRREPISVLMGHTAGVQQITFRDDGKQLASTSDDGTIRLWNLDRNLNGILGSHSGFVYDVAVSPDGRLAASAGWDDVVRVWEIESGKEVQTLDAGSMGATGIVFSLDSQQVCCTNRVWQKSEKGILSWNVVTGEKLVDAKCQHFDHFSVASVRPTFDRKGARIFCGDELGKVHVWDARSGEHLTEISGHESNEGWKTVIQVCLSSAGDRIASAGGKTVLLRDANSFKTIAALEAEGDLISIAFSPDDKFIAGSTIEGHLQIWDVDKSREVTAPEPGRVIYALAFSPDGTRLAGACADNTIRLWETEHYEEVGVLHGHDAYVHGVAFTPDGNRIISCSGDKTVRLWDTRAQ